MRKLLIIILLLPLVGKNNAIGQTTSTNTNPAATPIFWWRCSDGDSLLNFNNAKTIDSNNSLVFDSLPYAPNYSMVVVYKAIDRMETNVWRMEYTDSVDSHTRGLTSERIVSDSLAIRYTEHTTLIPIVNTLRQSAPDSTSPYVRIVLENDTLHGRILVSEIMYFDKRLGNSMLRRVQSALAVKYGITLGPVDYVDGNGRKIWKYVDSGLYHHRVTGIGHDSTYNLYQISSHSEMDGAMLTISTDSIENHSFLIVGDNDAPLAFVENDEGVDVLSRQWRAMAHGMDENIFSFIFDIRNIPIPTDSLVLLIGENIILPTVVNTNEVRFDNVWLPSDTCTFTLARGVILWQIAQRNASNTKGSRVYTNYEDNNIVNISSSVFNVFPNPTTGHYTIEVSGANQVQVTIYNVHGVVVETYTDREKDQYVFNGILPSGNSYYATITTESGSQTMKLVVN